MATKAQETAQATPEVIAVEIAKDRELRREERKALTAIPAADLEASAARISFAPTNMGEAMQLATMMAASNFVPNSLRGKAGDCLAVVMQASRWGMDPFAVALKVYFVKEGSPPAFEAQLVNAVVNSSGALSGRLRIEYEGEGDKLRCTVRGFLRADPSDEKVKTQSIARISTKNSPLWKNDPEQQLAYYTTRAWARLHCPEVLLGVYTPDELDIDPERARVVSPPMPRRDHHISDQLGAYDGEGHDDATGELAGETEKPKQTADQVLAETVDVVENTLADKIEAQIANAETVLGVSAIVNAMPSELTDEAKQYLYGVANKRKEAIRAQAQAEG